MCRGIHGDKVVVELIDGEKGTVSTVKYGIDFGGYLCFPLCSFPILQVFEMAFICNLDILSVI